ncbi:DUF2852 domain-containing protein [Maritimibacter alexandrii]|uniref:DUF2852 domain-containing protein n=1 Tax=Maritimibacter alexandrii TaxID=2570355 RepID=UPI0011084D81|nr:DUF2852 domain-containing protein [Maritimibacter alexandrii]
MTTMSETAPPKSEGWFNKTEAWLDERGKGAWIALMVLGFVFFWPVGLALLMYMIWSKRMFSKSCNGPHGRHRHGRRHGHDTYAYVWDNGRGRSFKSSGNTAFDSYKAETLQRLMDEQEQFEAFLDRLRQAKDKSEFDQFMNERADAARSGQIEDSSDDEDGDDDAVVAKEPK